MRQIAFVGALFLMALVGCAAPVLTASPITSGVIATSEQAAVIANQLTAISGPWTVGDVQHGRYESLWQGSTSDLSGQGAAARAGKGPRIVWRVDLSGPNGLEEIYIDETTGQLLDAITQGR